MTPTSAMGGLELGTYEPKIAMALRRYAHPAPAYTVRPETSDWKAIREVWERNAYVRRGIAPGPGEMWLDGGANMGAFADLAARCGADVIAYEAEPTNADLAALNTAGRSVEVRQAALVCDALEGSATLHVNSTPLGLRRHSLVKARRSSVPLTVPAHSATRVIAESGVVGAKLNIEGAEIALLSTWTPPACLRALAVEWSFDVDPSIAVLTATLARLEAAGFQVSTSRKVPEGIAAWPPEWFPPQLYIYAVRL